MSIPQRSFSERKEPYKMQLRLFRAIPLWGVLLLLGLLGLPMSSLAAGNTGNISGLVTDTSSQAISGATVTAGGKTTTTDSTGHYPLSSVPVGTQTVTASRFLYTSASTPVNVPRRTTVTASTLK